MGIINSIKMQWRGMSTAQKIDVILSIVCGVGEGAAAGIVSKELTKRSKSKIDKVCVPIFVFGIGIKAGDIARESLMKNIGAPIAAAVDKAKADNTKKEEEKTNE